MSTALPGMGLAKFLGARGKELWVFEHPQSIGCMAALHGRYAPVVKVPGLGVLGEGHALCVSLSRWLCSHWQHDYLQGCLLPLVHCLGQELPAEVHLEILPLLLQEASTSIVLFAWSSIVAATWLRP